MNKREKRILSQIMSARHKKTVAYKELSCSHDGMWRQGKAKPKCKSKQTKRVTL